MNNSFDKYQKRRLRSSYLSVIISIALVLFLVGFLGVILLKTNTISNHFKEKVAITIFLNDNAKSNDVEILKAELKKAEYAKDVVYISKKEAAEIYADEIGEDFVEFLGDNPLKNAIDVTLKSDFVTPEKMAEIENSGVLNSAAKKEMAEQLKDKEGKAIFDAELYVKFIAEGSISAKCEWKKEVDIIEDEKILRKKFEQTVEEFGGKKAWLSFWSKFRNLDIEFIQADVLGDFSSLTEHMKKNKGNNVIWLSNIFFSEPVIRNYRPNFVEEKYNLLVKELKGSSLDIEILGTHPLTDKIYNENTQ